MTAYEAEAAPVVIKGPGDTLPARIARGVTTSRGVHLLLIDALGCIL